MQKARTVKISPIFIVCVAFLFVLIIGKLIFVSVSDKVDGLDLKQFADSRNTKKSIITSERGTIFDSSGNVLAQDVNSYTVIAYLSESRTENPDHPYHVIDKEYTSSVLAPMLNMTEERILELLNYDAYQVELGPGGRGITELLKEDIEDKELPGIDFIKSTKRYYPNSDFMSYTVGYAKTDEDGNIKGELGIELKYNDLLTGKNGYKEYQQDMYGYQIANTPSITEEAINGSDIYLTIDTNVQMFTEQAMTTLEDSGLEWASISVVDAKTGDILGVSSSPSFNPNTKEITSYYDPFVSYEYEPGSVMKIFSFLGSMENGIYNGVDTYPSGTIKVDDATIKDWNNRGWGTITFNQGFMASSNTAATRLAQKLGREKLYDFYTKLGYAQDTKIELPNEQDGVVNFKYNTEIAAASFGQGISVTAVQMIRALTAISNDGTTLDPHIVKKIVNSQTGEIIYESSRTENTKVASKENVDAIKDLMRGVVDGRESMSTGKSYYVEGYDIIGKTGTAQIASTSGGYQTGAIDYIRSFAGLFPGNDPEIIVYVAVSKLKDSSALPNAIKTLIEDVATYKNIYGNIETNKLCHVKLDSYKNKEIDSVISSLDECLTTIKIGDGTKIIDQYPSKGMTCINGDKIFLLTNGTSFVMPNMVSWSKSDVSVFSNFTNIKFNYSGYGYVTSTSKKQGELITSSDTIDLTLEPKFKTLEETIKETDL